MKNLTQQQSVTINGVTITLDEIAKFAPIIYLHPSEKNFPCSIDWLLSQPGTQLQDANGVALVVNPSQHQLAILGIEGTTLVFSDDTAAGQAPQSGQPCTSTMYVSVQVPGDKAFIDLTFVTLYSFNGGQTGKWYDQKDSGEWKEFDVNLSDFAFHSGDIETCTVRIDAEKKSIKSIRYEAHGDSTFFGPDQVQYNENSTNPIVCSALYAHGTYNPNNIVLDENKQFFTPTAGEINAYVVKLVLGDYCTVGGNSIKWQPFMVDATGKSISNGMLCFMGIDVNGQAINNQEWSLFAGRIGGIRNNDCSYGLELDGSDLSFMNRTDTRVWLAAAKLIKKIPSEFFSGEGPQGPNTASRPWRYAAGVIIPIMDYEVMIRSCNESQHALGIEDPKFNGMTARLYDSKSTQCVWHLLQYSGSAVTIQNVSNKKYLNNGLNLVDKVDDNSRWIISAGSSKNSITIAPLTNPNIYISADLAPNQGFVFSGLIVPIADKPYITEWLYDRLDNFKTGNNLPTLHIWSDKVLQPNDLPTSATQIGFPFGDPRYYLSFRMDNNEVHLTPIGAKLYLIQQTDPITKKTFVMLCESENQYCLKFNGKDKLVTGAPFIDNTFVDNSLLWDIQYSDNHSAILVPCNDTTLCLQTTGNYNTDLIASSLNNEFKFELKKYFGT